VERAVRFIVALLIAVARVRADVSAWISGAAFLLCADFSQR